VRVCATAAARPVKPRARREAGASRHLKSQPPRARRRVVPARERRRRRAGASTGDPTRPRADPRSRRLARPRDSSRGKAGRTTRSTPTARALTRLQPRAARTSACDERAAAATAAKPRAPCCRPFLLLVASRRNIRTLINRGRGYQNLRYLLLKAKRLAVSNLELLAVRRIGKAA